VEEAEMQETSALGVIRESLEVDRRQLRAAMERVPPELRSRKPGPDRWSVAEVLEHLSIVEARVVGMLGAMIPSAPTSDATAESSAATLDRSRLRNRGERIIAPDQIQPTGTVSAEEAWTALERSRAQLLQLLDTAIGRDLAQINRQHPVLGSLNGYQWIAAVGGHEERHAAQIVEIAGQLSAGAGA
jgi:hypothetical protein